MKKMVSTKLGQSVCLCLLFVLLVFLLHSWPLNQIHGRSDAAIIVGFFGVVPVLLSCRFGLKPLAIASVGGYVVALLLGMLFNTDGVDPGGGSTNNLWVIWLYSYWAFLAIGLFVSLVERKRKGRSR